MKDSYPSRQALSGNGPRPLFFGAIEPVIDVDKEDFAHSQFRDGTIHDPLGQRKERHVVMAGASGSIPPGR